MKKLVIIAILGNFGSIWSRNIKNIINNLQNQHKVIILTRSRRLDPFYKLSQAKQIGLDFNQAFPNLPLIKLEGSNGKAIFNNGIICCGENDKGETLTQFMEKIDYIPSEIIFVDDKLHNLVNVESYMKRLQIPVTGLWYTRIHRSN